MKHNMSNFLKAGAAPLALSLALAAGPAFAQAAATPPANVDASTIIVTGSRISRTEATSNVPVSVLSSATIQNAGQTNLLDALRDLPIAGQSAGTSASNFSNSGNGEATINLRNLGSARTLVLINGRRSVGVPGSSAVDLNNIPADMIDHVEIVTGGASAIYGSDAVAGVVNIILKTNFKGIEVHAEDMLSSRGDSNTPHLSLLAGTDFAGGAGHIVANFTYDKQDGVPSSDRAYSQNDAPSGSSYTPPGIFFDQVVGNGYTFDSNNNVVPYTGAAAQRFNRASQRLLITPVERFLGSMLAHYDISPTIQAYAEGSYAKVKASSHIEPLAVDDSGSPGSTVYNFDGSPFIGIPATNPYLPAALVAASGGQPLDFRKRSTGIFDRSPHDDRDTWRAVIGVKGDISPKWHFDVSYEHSQVKDVTTNGAILMTNYGAALQATTIGGQIVCADAAARAAGCVPINIFGNQPYTAAQLKWLSTYSGGAPIAGATIGQSAAIAEFDQKNIQDVATAAITGSLFNLPNGPLGVAAGAEYHREKVSEVYDPFTASGLSSQQQNGNEFGQYNSKEAFIELNAPIFGHHPGIYAIELNGAARFSHYSTAGTVWSYKYGGSYAPTPDIRFNAMYARAVRAPNLNELYSPQANTAQQVTDPCDQAQGGGVDTGAAIVPLPAGCAAIPGIAHYLTTHQNFAYTLAQVQTIFGFTGGNPGLKAEATNTFTAGATITPTFLRNFLMTVDYYSIKVKNAVATIDPQISVTQCFQTGDPSFCGLVHRNANGFINEVDQVNINAASYRVAGIDVHAVYAFKANLLGHGDKINLDMYYNHKFKQEQTPFAGGFVSNELGTADTYASQQLGTGFKDQFTLNVNYATGPVTLNYRLKYMSAVTASSGAYFIPAYTYSDLQAKVTVGADKRFEFYIGANNRFDKQPPFIRAGNSQWPGTNTVADTYDLLGRMLYAGVKARF